MRRPRRQHLLALMTATLVLTAACTSGGGDTEANGTSATPSSSTRPGGSDGGGPSPEPPMVQDLWLYERIATIDAAGSEVELTTEVLALMADDETTAIALGGDLMFRHHPGMGARLVDLDGEVRTDLTVQAGLLEAGGERTVAVIATPDAGAERPIDDTHRVQLDLTSLGDRLAPGDPLIMDVGFLQAYGDGGEEGGLDGAELLGHRLAAGRANLVGADDDGIVKMALSTELGSAVDGSVWSDMPAKSHRMMDGFRKGFQGCRLGLKCVKNYFDEMVDVAVDFGMAFDCNTGTGPCIPTTTTTTTGTSTTAPPDTTTPATPRPPTSTNGASVFGDPHLRTFDGHHYSMQAVGEFVAARSDDLEIQIRTSAVEGRTDVSLLSGAAVRVDGHTLSVASGLAFLDGAPLEVAPLAEPRKLGTATLSTRGNGFEIVTGSGQTVAMTSVSSRAFELWVSLDEGDDTAFVGLFGDNDGDEQNDFSTRDGGRLADPDFDELYGSFVEDWRLRDDESLLHYAEGETTETFTDRSLPRAPVTLDGLPAADRARAAAVCRASGIVDDVTIDHCTLDYALTGDIGFVRAALTVDTVVGIWNGRLLADGSDARALDLGPDDGHGPDDDDVATEPSGDVRTVDAPWSRTANAIRQGSESATRVNCPPGGAPHTVWGTDIYTDDSSVCTAAVHRGLLTYAAGGEILIEHRPGLGSYRGTTRHDVITREWDSWPGSFVFIGARGLAIEGEEGS